MNLTAFRKRHKNVSFVKKRLDFLGVMPKEAVVAEVGVHIGEFSQHILDICKPTKLHLIDAWEHIPESEDWYFKIPDRDKVVVDKFKENKNVFIHKLYSDKAALLFPDFYFDWVYIDANHSYDFVKSDLELYSKKIKYGGYLTGHDYALRTADVVRAVDEFIAKGEWEFKIRTLYEIDDSWALQRIPKPIKFL